MLPPELMLPIGHANMNIMRILDSVSWNDGVSHGVNERDNLVVLFYSANQTFNFRIPEFTSEKFNVLSRTVSTEGYFEEAFEMDINDNILVDGHIKSVLLRNFNVELTVTASPGVDLSQIEFTTILFDNVIQMDYVGTAADGISRQPVEINNGNVPHEYKRFPAGGGSIIFQFENIWVHPRNDNELPFKIRLTADNAAAIPVGSTITYEYRIVDLEWTVIYGDFPPARRIDEHSETHSFDISDFDGFRFVDPRITIDIESNVGTTFEFQIDFIEAFHSDNPTDVVRAVFNNPSTGNIDSESTYALINKRPRYPWSDPVSMFMNERPFDRHDGRTNLLFDRPITPNRMRYEYSVSHTNVPDDYDTPHFLTPHAGLEITAIAELPLWLRERREGEERGFRLTETIYDIDLERVLPDVRLEGVKVRLRVRNGLPSDVLFTVAEFLDKDGNNIDIPGFVMSYRIYAPPTNPNGTVNHAAVAPRDLYIRLNEEQYDRFRLVDQIVYHLHADLKNLPDSHIRITPDDFFSVHVGVLLRGDLHTGMFNQNND